MGFDGCLGQASDGPLFCLAVSLELGDVSLVSVPPESLQPAPDRGSRGQLIAQLQELLYHWALWSAVKSRWVIVGKWLSTLLPLCLAVGSQPPPANEPGLVSHSLGLPASCVEWSRSHNSCCLLSTYYAPVIMLGRRAEPSMLGLQSQTTRSDQSVTNWVTSQ